MNAFINLEKLNISHNRIEYASPVKCLKKLKILNLDENQIQDINFLENENLIIKELNLRKNLIKNISSLLKLENLEILNIEYQKLTKQQQQLYYDYQDNKKIKYIYINEEEQKKFLEIKQLLVKKVKKCLIDQFFKNQYFN